VAVTVAIEASRASKKGGTGNMCLFRTNQRKGAQLVRNSIGERRVITSEYDESSGDGRALLRPLDVAECCWHLL
jgi:hypothetical protein